MTRRKFHVEKEYQFSREGRIINHRLLPILLFFILNRSSSTTSSKKLIDAIFENCYITVDELSAEHRIHRFDIILWFENAFAFAGNSVTLMAGCLISGIGSLITV